MISSLQCGECRAPLVDDYQNGEVVCSRCGLVVHDRIPNAGPEANATVEEAAKHARATGRNTLAQHDMGIAGTIDSGSKDFSGKQISRSILSQMNNLRRWQQRLRVTTTNERRMANVLAKINEACNALSLPRNVTETASMIYRNLNTKVDLRSKSIVATAVAVTYMACKQCDVVYSMNEITAGMCQPAEVRSKARLAAKYYRYLVMEAGGPRSIRLPVEKYISKISNIAGVDVRAERLALKLADKTKNQDVIVGKDPNGIAAAYLYVASVLLGQDIVQRDVSETSGITEVTIRNRCKDILGSHRIRITLKPISRDTHHNTTRQSTLTGTLQKRHAPDAPSKAA